MNEETTGHESDESAITRAPEGVSLTADSAVAVHTPPPADKLPTTPAVLPGLAEPGRYTGRFALTYALLGVVLVGAIVGFIVVVLKPGHHNSGPWAGWKPTGGTNSQLISSIAQHVETQYKLSATGGQLVSIIPTALQVTVDTHKILISEVAVRKVANSNTGVVVVPTSGDALVQMCGLGAACAIDSGQATLTRGRLVRREALEMALLTFKYTSINTLIAYMPPPPGTTTTRLLYLQRSTLGSVLSKPLSATLPLAKPPLPSAPDTAEAATIDKLTLPALYGYSFQALADGSSVLILDPIAS